MSVLLLHFACLFSLFEAPRTFRAFGVRLLPAVVFDLVVALLFLVDVRHRSNALLVGFWGRHFVSTASIPGFVHSIYTKVWPALQEALPSPLQSFAILAFPGLAAIAIRRWRLAVFLAFYMLEILVLSRLHYVPLGGRTEAFAIPAVVLMIVAAFDLAPLAAPKRVAVHCSLAACLMVIAIRNPFPSRYFAVDDAFTIDELEQLAGEHGAVLVYPWASWLVAYYSSWPYELQASRDWMCGFQPRFTRANTEVLDPSSSHLGPQLSNLLDGLGFSAVYYVAIRENARLPRKLIFSELARRGFEGRRLRRCRKSVLFAFRRQVETESDDVRPATSSE
jgi:hypothetical protein